VRGTFETHVMASKPRRRHCSLLQDGRAPALSYRKYLSRMIDRAFHVRLLALFTANSRKVLRRSVSMLFVYRNEWSRMDFIRFFRYARPGALMGTRCMTEHRIERSDANTVPNGRPSRSLPCRRQKTGVKRRIRHKTSCQAT